jgi:hypothetical protein
MFCVLCSKKGAISSQLIDNLEVTIRDSSPFRGFQVGEKSFLSLSKRLLVLWSSNECDFNSLLPNFDLDGGVLPLYYGICLKPFQLLKYRRDSMFHRDLNLETGRFCGGVVDLNNDKFWFGTTITRLEPLYMYEDDNILMIGTWAGVLDGLAKVIGQKKTLGTGSYSFMNAGYFCNDETFYPGVTAIPPYSTVHLDHDYNSVINNEFLQYLCSPSEPSKSFYDEMCQTLLDACEPLRNVNNSTFAARKNF